MSKKVHINSEQLTKGRGSQSNPHNRYLKNEYVQSDEAKMAWQIEEELEDENPRTQIIEVFPKTILSKNDSPDLGFNWSINPYNGCEHGCTYCYARNTHEYWGYSAGKDFEEKILVKKNAAQLLEETFRSGKWKPEMIVLSGNTDCYQPIERKLELTRSLLKVFLKYKHPVGLITKNALILRDLDILSEMAKLNLVSATISITTLREEVRRVMEPRTSSVAQRLKAVDALVKAGIPINVNMAPIIYGINSDEIFDVAKAVGERGASSLSYIMGRLNGQVAGIFEDWVRKIFPERADKILNQVKETHGGTLNESRFKTRMKGEGKYAEQIADTFKLARKKFITAPLPVAPNYSLFVSSSNGQLSIF
ncbi:MAG: PA0069 family radical SAM protein [Flavobacteriales bacterium]